MNSMDSEEKVLSKLLNQTYVSQSLQAIQSRGKQISHLFEQRKCPVDGWDDTTIELLMTNLSMMDSNNFPSNCAVGERESRFASELVAKRHFRMGHGVGRSGDLCEVQPKAAGSSVLAKLANALVLDVLQQVGVPNTKSCFIAPVATGMSLVLCLLALKKDQPHKKYVIWPRIDQKSCFKCISTAGLTPVIIQTKVVGDSLVTDIEAVERKVVELGSENIACVLATTSCFAPRHPDDIEALAVLCKKHDIAHVVNNAYGVQSSKCLHLIEQASRIGRVDVYVQSTDKNFLVPVGGSIVAGFDPEVIRLISCSYPGRASSVPSTDVLITLLHLGVKGYKQLLEERKASFAYLKESLENLAKKYGEKILQTKCNQISIAMSLDKFSNVQKSETEIGSMLFLRNVSGARVIKSDGSEKFINGCLFKNWGAHCDQFSGNYLTVAAAIGCRKTDVDTFLKRLDKVLSKFAE